MEKKTFKCDICQASYSESGTLKRHLRTHIGEKQFKCDICQASFSRSGNLKSHLRSHSGEKPLKRDLCQACFSELGTLKRHLRAHSRDNACSWKYLNLVCDFHALTNRMWSRCVVEKYWLATLVAVPLCHFLLGLRYWHNKQEAQGLDALLGHLLVKNTSNV